MEETLKDKKLKHGSSVALFLGATLATASGFASDEDYPVLEVINARCHALVAAKGAHVLSYRSRQAKQPILYEMPLEEARRINSEGGVIRSGVPLCWPWFAAGGSGDLHPFHGFMRDRIWQLVERVDEAECTELVFRFESDESTLALWPHKFRIDYRMRLGESLRLELTTWNEDDASFEISPALHSYYAISDLEQVAVRGLRYEWDRNSKEFIDRTGDVPGAELPIGFGSRYFDRIENDTTLIDRAWNRDIALRGIGSRTMIVWNPGPKEGAPEAYRRYVCLETANVLTDMRTIDPGESHTIGVEIRLK